HDPPVSGYHVWGAAPKGSLAVPKIPRRAGMSHRPLIEARARPEVWFQFGHAVRAETEGPLRRRAAHHARRAQSPISFGLAATQGHYYKSRLEKCGRRAFRRRGGA